VWLLKPQGLFSPAAAWKNLSFALFLAASLPKPKQLKQFSALPQADPAHSRGDRVSSVN
jgi:hypothetical protein